MNLFKRSILLLLPAILLFSCISQKKTIYLQERKQRQKYTNVYSKAEVITENYKVNTNDYIYIRVITSNEKVAAYYNISGGTNSGMNMNIGTGGDGGKLISYLVDDNGDIDFPSIGKIQVKGLTRSEVKLRLTGILKTQIDNFTLLVALINTHFTILGEAHAGIYPMPKDQMTIYEAIAMSGDLTTYSKRRAVKIIRPSISGISSITTVNLTDKRLLDSKESYIYPNDIIYIEPIHAKVFGFGETFSLSLVTSLISFYLLLKTFGIK